MIGRISSDHTCLCDNAARLHSMLRAVCDQIVQRGARARSGREPRVDDILLRVVVRVSQQVLRGVDDRMVGWQTRIIGREKIGR